MNSVIKRPYSGALLFSLIVTGCSTTSESRWETQSAPPEFVNGTKVLAELILVASREEVLAGDGLMAGWREKSLQAGYRDDEIVDGSEATAWTYCYAHNSGVSPCQHNGHYVAHVPEQLRSGLHYNDGRGKKGDLVELEMTRTASGYLVSKVVAVYRRSGDWIPCREVRETGPGGLATITVGPPRASWIECDDIGSDGWVRRPVAGAPLGWPVSEWIKLP